MLLRCAGLTASAGLSCHSTCPKIRDCGHSLLVVYLCFASVIAWMDCVLVPEITEEIFEDLLACDDVLLDYFNTFLRLPVSFHEFLSRSTLSDSGNRLQYCLIL